MLTPFTSQRERWLWEHLEKDKKKRFYRPIASLQGKKKRTPMCRIPSVEILLCRRSVGALVLVLPRKQQPDWLWQWCRDVRVTQEFRWRLTVCSVVLLVVCSWPIVVSLTENIEEWVVLASFRGKLFFPRSICFFLILGQSVFSSCCELAHSRMLDLVKSMRKC